MSEIKLKPCPFCGGKVDFNYNMNLEPDGIRCMKCRYVLKYMRIRVEKSTEPYRIVMNKMATEWNRRAENE